MGQGIIFLIDKKGFRKQKVEKGSVKCMMLLRKLIGLSFITTFPLDPLAGSGEVC